MKMILIGMDGVKESTFKRGWTPYIDSLLKKSNTLKLHEDLISRGWAEIVLGKHACETEAVYEGPVCYGTHTWSDKYKLSDSPGLGEKIKPIWQVLNEMGFKVGVMNVPTTFPAPKVDGFLVSGGGGGGPIGQYIAKAQCWPQEIHETLASTGYIVDERLPSLLGEKQLFKPQDFFNQLQLMNQKRTESFIDLANQFKVDFGFVVYKSSTVTAETLLLPVLENPNTSVDKSEFVKASENFYRNLDGHVKKLVDSFPEAEVVLVSDHSMAVRNYSVNANVFLSEIGLQTPSSAKAGFFSLVKSFKHLIPLSIRKLLKKNPKIKSSYESMTTFDTKSSKAFSISFTQAQHGIFINDEKRFGGPVKVGEISKYIDQIIEEFNRHELSVLHNFQAYTLNDTELKTADQFPDVVLVLPDGYLTSSESKAFVSEYLPTMQKDVLLEAMKGKHHTIKAHEPLACNVNGGWLVETSDNKKDLRLVYDHIVKFFKQVNS
jgi:predicted AlkP superfamily phosphohydrolase/phosphomutase